MPLPHLHSTARFYRLLLILGVTAAAGSAQAEDLIAGFARNPSLRDFSAVCGEVPGEESKSPPPAPPAPYHSPFQVAFSPDGARIAVSDHTAGSVAMIETSSGKILSSIALRGRPAGLAWSRDGARIYVSEYGAGTVAEVDAATGQALRRFEVGLRPLGLALAHERGLLLAANSDNDSVSVLDLASGKEKARIRVEREPFYLAIAPCSGVALATNSLPGGKATQPDHAAAVSFLDLEKMERTLDLRLPPGSTNLRQVAVSPDGRWAYLAHTLGRVHLPTTQLDRGWVNTNALSIIDVPARKIHATVLLDSPMEGAANPWGLALMDGGKWLWVSLAGSQQVARIDLAKLHEFIEGKLPDDHRLAQKASYSPGTESIWLRIKLDGSQRSELVNDLAALYAADLIQRVPIRGNGPRGLDVSPDGKLLAAGAYYSGEVFLMDAASGKMKAAIPLGPPREPDPARMGEMIFHDATYCFQHWLSCSTCHQNGRVDGMNWDLLNDGMGNPKNSRSLLWSHKTPPAMSLGVRETMEEATKAGFIHIQFHQPVEKELRAVEAYIRSLEPERSPHHLLPDGQPAEEARRGKAIFENETVGCTKCHPAPLYTDLKVYDVDTKGEFDRTVEFDTPTLVELHRTGPYLHDGSSVTLEELFTERNRSDKHGKTSHLTKEELRDLIAFLLSL